MTTGSYIDPYEALANAVVLQAVKDWREASAKLTRGRKNINAQAMKDECERFFTSSYFNTFTELDGNVLLMKLKQEVEDDS